MAEVRRRRGLGHASSSSIRGGLRRTTAKGSAFLKKLDTYCEGSVAQVCLNDCHPPPRPAILAADTVGYSRLMSAGNGVQKPPRGADHPCAPGEAEQACGGCKMAAKFPGLHANLLINNALILPRGTSARKTATGGSPTPSARQ
jgi:hypothetical protein